MTTDQRGSLITRRRLLVSAGVLAVGAAALAELDLGPSGTGQRSPSPSGAPGAAAAGEATSSPAASPSASPGPRRTFRSRPDIAAPLVELTTLHGIPAPGLVFLTPANGDGADGPTIVDSSGELVWMRPDTAGNAADFRMATLDGAPVLVWWEGANNAGIGAGEHVVMDAAYRELMRIEGGSGRKADLHDLRLTTRRTALFFADASAGPGTVPGSTGAVPVVMDCAVQELDLATGELRFEWHSVDHIDVAESVIDPPTAANAVWDYFHGNSIDEDPDGTLLVSARNTSAVYKVDRATGRVLWRLGGLRSDFAMGQGASFALQHDARRQPDGTITIFDDGQAPGTSRGIVLHVDEQAMTATLVREFRQPQGRLATSQGNVQILPNGHVFIGWGSVPRFSEFAADGRLVLDAGFTASQSYRDGRFAWAGRPASPPDIAVDSGSDGVVVYASWNGATEIASWDVLVGADHTSLRRVASAPKQGFETVIALRTMGPLAGVVAVSAKDALGAVLGTSSPVLLPD